MINDSVFTVSKRPFNFVFRFFMFGLFAAILGRGAEAYKNKETGLELPKVIGSFTFDKAEPYRFAEEAGESVAYGSKEASSAATIHIRHFATGTKKTAEQLVE